MSKAKVRAPSLPLLPPKPDATRGGGVRAPLPPKRGRAGSSGGSLGNSLLNLRPSEQKALRALAAAYTKF